MSTYSVENNKKLTPEQAVHSASELISPVRKPNGQYGPGTSGNLKGRPRNIEHAWSLRQLNADVLKEANELVPITKGGKVVYMSMHRVILRQFFNKSAKGDAKEQKMALDYIERAQNGRETIDRTLYGNLERIELQIDKAGEIFSEEEANKVRNDLRKRTRRI
jgi:hypothetical protein